MKYTLQREGGIGLSVLKARMYFYKQDETIGAGSDSALMKKDRKSGEILLFFRY